MQEVLVSVLMTAYNREAYIGEAIDSVILSSYKNFELLIVDDCSTDNTLAIARNYSDKDSRIKVYKNEKNLGQFQNRNRAAELARGKYIKYLDSDDTITIQGLEEMVNGMNAHPRCGIGLEFNNCTALPDGFVFPFVLDPQNAYLWHFDKGGLLFPGPSKIIYSAEKFKQAGGFQTGIGSNADIFLNLSVASFSDTIIFDGKLVNWRRHDDQVAAEQGSNIPDMMIEILDIHRKMLADEKCPVNKIQRKRIIFSQKVLYLRRATVNYLLKGKIAAFIKLIANGKVPLYYFPFIIVPLRFIRRYYN